MVSLIALRAFCFWECAMSHTPPQWQDPPVNPQLSTWIKILNYFFSEKFLLNIIWISVETKKFYRPPKKKNFFGQKSIFLIFFKYQVTNNQNNFPYYIRHQEVDESVKKCPHRPLVAVIWPKIASKSSFKYQVTDNQNNFFILYPPPGTRCKYQKVLSATSSGQNLNLDFVKIEFCGENFCFLHLLDIIFTKTRVKCLESANWKCRYKVQILIVSI